MGRSLFLKAGTSLTRVEHVKVAPECAYSLNNLFFGQYNVAKTSVVDPDPYWIRIQELPGPVFGIRIRIHTCKYTVG